MPIADTVHFGPAAACLKHSIPGDFSLVVRTDVDLTALSGSELNVESPWGMQKSDDWRRGPEIEKAPQ